VEADQRTDAPVDPAGPETGLVQRVLRWLRAGYPDGVPQRDYVALLGILRRNLTDTELGQVVGQLASEADAGEQLLTRHVVERRIADVVKGPVEADDVGRVSARLAAAGWPLGPPGAAPEPDPDGRAGVVGRVVSWLRSGYPTGLPVQDYVPLLALLRRRLSDDEARQVGRRLVDDGLVSGDPVDIGTAVAEVTSELPTPADVERVRHYLVEHGWPADLQV
jgi:hypothetical protein